jgi:hypothetical protein
MGGLFDSNEIIPDDDYHEELGVDYHEIHPSDSSTGDYIGDTGSNESIRETEEKENPSSPQLRQKRLLIKKMPGAFRRKFPNATSILFTNHDGSQILLIGE